MAVSIPRSAVTLAVLAGGKGARLGGRAKGNLLRGGRTLLDRQLALVGRFFEVLLIGDALEAYRTSAVRPVGDVVPGQGAPGGLVSALLAARTEWVLVTPCDLVALEARTLDDLAAAIGADDEAACFVDAVGGVQPFPGLYRARTGLTLRPALGSGISVKDLVGRLNLSTVPAPATDAVANVNTWDDARALGVEDCDLFRR